MFFYFNDDQSIDYMRIKSFKCQQFTIFYLTRNKSNQTLVFITTSSYLGGNSLISWTWNELLAWLGVDKLWFVVLEPSSFRFVIKYHIIMQTKPVKIIPKITHGNLFKIENQSIHEWIFFNQKKITYTIHKFVVCI